MQLFIMEVINLKRTYVNKTIMQCIEKGVEIKEETKWCCWTSAAQDGH
jgi:hypothetical protein